MKVYILVYSQLYTDDESIIGAYSTYKNAENATPPHENYEFYNVVEVILDETYFEDNGEKKR